MLPWPSLRCYTRQQPVGGRGVLCLSVGCDHRLAPSILRPTNLANENPAGTSFEFAILSRKKRIVKTQEVTNLGRFTTKIGFDFKTICLQNNISFRLFSSHSTCFQQKALYWSWIQGSHLQACEHSQARTLVYFLNRYLHRVQTYLFKTVAG